MFVNFFFHLRKRGIPVSITEFLTLLEALEKGLDDASLTGFYWLARSVLIKRVEHFDRYDAAFQEFFKDLPFSAPERRDDLSDELLQWLEGAQFLRELTDEQQQALQQLDLDELRQQFEERLQEQTERHDGGSHWIGTGGTSPFGHSGRHPSGMRVGGSGQHRSALQVASQRRFKNLRTDRVLDTRQIGVALRKLRHLSRKGGDEQLDLDATIDETARNAGDIELVFRPPRQNQVKLLLLFDVGGSMNPHTELTSRLFSAAHRAHHFKAFKAYYFHNCFYETLYSDMSRQKGESTRQILANLDRSWRCFVVGDAAMAPPELTQPGGCINYFQHNEEAGITWLRRLRETIPRTAWINPDKPQWWGSYTTRQIAELFPMFPLTIDGLDRAIDEIR